MRGRVGFLACVATLGFAALVAVEPRIDHGFPSMVDDWSAIANAPDQLRSVIRLENPEEQRYRPGFVAWNALQWHTLGAPTGFAGPRLWGLARIAILVLGLAMLTRLLVTSTGPATGRWETRWLLTLAVPLLIVTVPAGAIDLARYGPQEPLMVGCMSLGAALLVRSTDGLLEPVRPAAPVLAASAIGLAAWWLGVLQKETSLCVLLLLPFLVPTVLGQRARWLALDGRRRAVLLALAVGVLLPFVPMLIRTVQLMLADSRVYEDVAAGRSVLERLFDQIEDAGPMLHSPVFTVVAAFAIVALIVAALRGVDWLGVGLVVTAFAFVASAAESGVVASRYYLPPLTLLALAGARVVSRLRAELIVTVSAVAIGAGLWQLHDARGWVQWWVDGEERQGSIVREAAARAAGGCRVDVTGRNVELVDALPVLMPLADEPARDCAPGERFVVVVDWFAGETTSDDPVLAACAPEPTPVWDITVARIVRCTQAA